MMKLRVTRTFTVTNVIDMSAYLGLDVEEAKAYEEGVPPEEALELLLGQEGVSVTTKVEEVRHL